MTIKLNIFPTNATTDLSSTESHGQGIRNIQCMQRWRTN